VTSEADDIRGPLTEMSPEQIQQELTIATAEAQRVLATVDRAAVAKLFDVIGNAMSGRSKAECLCALAGALQGLVDGMCHPRIARLTFQVVLGLMSAEAKQVRSEAQGEAASAVKH
jgi:hypothetical protein